MPSGSLAVVGTGVQLCVHVTPEARDRLERADEVLYLADPATASWLERLNPRCRSLHGFYRDGARRNEIYDAIVDEILARVRRGGDVCVAFPGHPGLFSNPTREAIRRAREEGFATELLPGISAEDCLFADLGVDPGRTGWQSYEATDLLVHGRVVDPSAALVVWQVSVVGDPYYSQSPNGSHLPELVGYLGRWYDAEHEVVVYEASPYPVLEPSIERVPLGGLAAARPGPMATLYVPPAVTRPADAAMQARLGLA
jgi:precorrin-6B methylase 1